MKFALLLNRSKFLWLYQYWYQKNFELLNAIEIMNNTHEAMNNWNLDNLDGWLAGWQERKN